MTRKHTWPIRLLCLLLVLALAPLQVLAEEWPGMDAFGLPEELPTPPFTDVSVHAWYYPYVRVQHTLGLMAGTGNDAFSPNGTVPLTQGLTVAVRVYEKYWGIPDTSAELGSPWYTYYINRAREYGILPQTLEGVSVFRAATRAELAEILSRSLPEVALEPIHQVDALPDYTSQDLYWNGVITLYRAGVLMAGGTAGAALCGCGFQYLVLSLYSSGLCHGADERHGQRSLYPQRYRSAKPNRSGSCADL